MGGGGEESTRREIGRDLCELLRIRPSAELKDADRVLV